MSRTTEIADPRVPGVAADAAVLRAGLANAKADAAALPIEPGAPLVAEPLGGHAMAAANAAGGTRSSERRSTGSMPGRGR